MVIKCLDCGKEKKESHQTKPRQRCWSCYVADVKKKSKVYQCLDCNKKLKRDGGIRCRKCAGIRRRGKNFPYCINCGARLHSYTAKRCPSCVYKFTPPAKNLKHSLKTKERIRKSMLGKFIGDRSPLWRASSSLNLRIRVNEAYLRWRDFIYRRDNFTCQICGERGKKLNVDHIKPLALLLKENNITDLESALNCKELWDMKNARTLCIECHKKTDTYLQKYHTYVKQLQN